MCGAPKQGGSLAGIDLTTQTVIQGSVWHDGAPVAGAYVRLLDSTDEFTAEVVTSPEGEFRFFAAPGTWTLRSLSPIGRAERSVTVALPYGTTDLCPIRALRSWQEAVGITKGAVFRRIWIPPRGRDGAMW